MLAWIMPYATRCMADGADVYTVFLDRFEESGVAYFVTGSVASSLYGEPRFTEDLDLVVSIRTDDVDRLLASFSPTDFYVPPRETLVTEARREQGGHFNLPYNETGVRADVYVAGTDPLHRWAFDHRRRLQLSDDRAIWLAPPEYVVLRKLQWRHEGGGERHEQDVARVLAVLGDSIDLRFLDHEAERLGVGSLWQRLRP